MAASRFLPCGRCLAFLRQSLAQNLAFVDWCLSKGRLARKKETTGSICNIVDHIISDWPALDGEVLQKSLDGPETVAAEPRMSANRLLRAINGREISAEDWPYKPKKVELDDSKFERERRAELDEKL